MGSDVFNEIASLVTESRNEFSMNIDTCSVQEVLKIINDEDKKVPLAVEKEVPYISIAVDLVVAAFQNGGRLIYIGAGTSGRLGVLDASECPPTFGTPPELVQGLIAGGLEALIKAQEGSEDLRENAIKDLKEINLSEKDIVCGIAASRRTPYVVAGVEFAKSQGCKTIYITCTPREEMNINVDVAICPVVGPEVVMGSTRMKSGTAQKLVLNMVTTTAMIRMGKVYKNMMVDLQMNSRKLEERSKRTIMIITGLDYKNAEDLLKKANGHVKTAIVMNIANITKLESDEFLKQANGFVRQAIELAKR
jgi:N-acetylmuramic acid 6-phosphate etherase